MKRLILLMPVLCLAFACGPDFGRRHGDPTPPPPPVGSADGGTCTGGGGGLFGGGSGGTDCGSSQQTQSKTLGTRCVTETDCGVGESCEYLGDGDRACLKECAADSDCGSGGTCFKQGGAKGVCAQSCTSDSQCPGVLACMTPPDDPGHKICGPNLHGAACFRNDQCGPGWSCVGSGGPVSSQEGVCTLQCTSDSVCGKGTVCTSNLCLRPCSSDGECSSGLVCSNGACRVQQDYNLPVGAACGNNGSCAQPYFCASEDQGWPHGYCTGSCESHSDCDSTSLCISNGDGALCMQKCYEPGTQSNCRDAYTCIQVTNQNYGVCMPK